MNGIEGEEKILTSSEKAALLTEYKALFESEPLRDEEGFVPSVTKLGDEMTSPISP